METYRKVSGMAVDGVINKMLLGGLVFKKTNRGYEEITFETPISSVRKMVKHGLVYIKEGGKQ